MFDINDFMNAPCVDDTHIVKHGSEEFKLRRLNGAERLHYNDLDTQYARTRYVLARGLLSGPNAAPIGDENAAKFIERYGALAETLYADIFDFTEQSLQAEAALWEDTRKN